MDDLLQLFFNGLAVGSVIALGAVGLTLTYGILRLSNFAHGDFITLGAYLAWAINGVGLPVVLAIPLGAVGTILVMILAEGILWRPMRIRRATPTTLIIISIGLALFLRNLVLLVWGSSNQSFEVPLQEAIAVGGIRIAYYRIIVILLAVVTVIALHFLLQKTKIGKAMRAVADNLDLARISGINVEQVVLWTWVMTGVLVTLSGGMYGLITTLRPTMGWYLLIPMFASVILGGIGNPYGAIAGGLIIGVAQELSVPLLGPDYKAGVALVLMMVLLLLRPQGLFRSTL